MFIVNQTHLELILLTHFTLAKLKNFENNISCQTQTDTQTDKKNLPNLTIYYSTSHNIIPRNYIYENILKKIEPKQINKLETKKKKGNYVSPHYIRK